LFGAGDAERAQCPWFILSSRWGLVAPEEVVASYDLYLGDQSQAYRRAWAEFVVAQLVAAVGPPWSSSGACR